VGAGRAFPTLVVNAPRRRIHAPRVRHTKPHEVGKIAAEAGVKKLVLTHLWSNEGEDRLKQEVAAHFSGKIVVGQDLLTV